MQHHVAHMVERDEKEMINKQSLKSIQRENIKYSEHMLLIYALLMN